MADSSQSEPLLNGGPAPTRKSTSSRWIRKRLPFIVMFVATTSLLFGVLSGLGLGWPSPVPPRWPDEASLLVTLPEYGSFQGIQIIPTFEDQQSMQPVDAWLAVEYATQPVGENRFMPVGWPAPFEGTKNATAFGPACWQNPHAPFEQSEACLLFNVYRPQGIPMEQKLPVLIYVHGGSFVGGSTKSFDGAAFVGKSSQPLMVVTMQYRLGALGNIPSKLMEEEGLLNLGLRDQKQMLLFWQKYGEYFGGDSNEVTLGGLSAGAHSVGLHLFHNYGEDRNKPLFNRAILASGSPTARAFPGVNYPLYQRQFAEFMDYINCPSSPNSVALKCLRDAEADDIQFISSAMYTASEYNITWPWQPVSPGPLIEQRGSVSGRTGEFFKVPILITSSTDDGSPFAPKDLRTNAQFFKFWTNLIPGLTPQDLEDLESLYPDPMTGPQPGQYTPQTMNYVSPQFQRVSAAYGDYSYICPVQDTASILADAGATVYKARFNTPNWSATYLGVPHASDASYANGQAGTQYPEIANIYSSYYASFIVTGNPNSYAAPEAAKWEVYSGTGGVQLVVNPPQQGGPKMEGEAEGIRMEQCAWWRDPLRADRLNK